LSKYEDVATIRMRGSQLHIMSSNANFGGQDQEESITKWFKSLRGSRDASYLFKELSFS